MSEAATMPDMLNEVITVENHALEIAKSLDAIREETDDEDDITEISIYGQIIYGVMFSLAGAKAKLEHGVPPDQMLDDTLKATKNVLRDVQREVTAAMTRMSLMNMRKKS